MDVKRFNEARSAVRHFTLEMTDDYCYGWTWAQVVNEYLRIGYNTENNQFEVVVMGVTYKILKRRKVTAFYDAAGNTLFDVTHERLEKEYEWMANNGTGITAENENLGEESAEAVEAQETEQMGDEEEDVPFDRTDDNVIPMGKASLKEIITGLPAPTVEEIEAAKGENAKPVKQRAKEKLEKELEVANDGTFAEPIIGYLIGRCKEDDGLAEDVVQEHKTWQKCFDYIYSQARKQSTGNCAAVRDEVVYEWAEDYYHLDDKAEAEKKAKEDAERKKKQAEAAKKAYKAKVEKKAPAIAESKAKPAAEELKQSPKPEKPKRNSRDMDGQLDMFAMMGM